MTADEPTGGGRPRRRWRRALLPLVLAVGAVAVADARLGLAHTALAALVLAAAALAAAGLEGQV